MTRLQSFCRRVFSHPGTLSSPPAGPALENPHRREPLLAPLLFASQLLSSPHSRGSRGESPTTQWRMAPRLPSPLGITLTSTGDGSGRRVSGDSLGNEVLSDWSCTMGTPRTGSSRTTDTPGFETLTCGPSSIRRFAFSFPLLLCESTGTFLIHASTRRGSVLFRRRDQRRRIPQMSQQPLP